MAEETVFDLNRGHEIKRSDFPSNFLFGVGTSAYQVEGAWNTHGKGLSIWDCFALRHPEIINDGTNGCVTVDNYSRMKEDVQLLKKMGVNSYRFSLSWSRILPGGKVSMGKNLEAIKHYNELIDELKANDIEPFVTLFHWDLPNALEEEYMGFLSAKIVDDFLNYVDICFWEFGDRVKNWVTLNEPYRFTFSGYVEGTGPPGRGGTVHKQDGSEYKQDGDPETEPYTVAYNLLNCHAAAYRKYQEDYKDLQHGKVGITLDTNFFKPDNPNKKEDVKAVEYAYDFMFGWFMEPLTNGIWPESMQNFATTSTPNHPNGRVLPKFSDDQRNKLINSYDFLGINYYTANFAQYQADPNSESRLGFSTDCHYKASGRNYLKELIGPEAFTDSWVYLCPHELGDLLAYIKKRYKVTKDFVITENGAPEKNDHEITYEQARQDTFRLTYLKTHLDAIRVARRNHIKVAGYFVWSFMDSYEWSSGYTVRFGMIYVDFNNDLLRYPKNSAIWFKKFLSEKKPWLFKRTISNVEQEDEENDMAVEENDNAVVVAKEAVEVIPKLKKAKA